MRYALLGLTACALPFAVAAQNPEPLEPMTVVGSRTPVEANRLAAAIQVITRDDIQRSAATSLADLLRGAAGVEVLDAYGDGSSVIVGLRGFGEAAGSNTLILLDDQPLNNTDIGAANIGRIDPSTIERIEILPGGTTLWGNQAVGGVIRIVSRQDTTTSAGIRYGSFADKAVRLRTGTTDGNWSASIDGLLEERDNYRDHNRLQRDQAGASLRWGREQSQAHVQVRWLDEYLQTPGALYAEEAEQDRRQSAADFAEDFSALRSWTVDGGLTTALNDSWHFSLSAGSRRDDGRFRLSFRGFQTDPATQERDVATVRPQLTWKLGTALPTQLAFGMDYQSSQYKLRTQIGPQDNDQRQHDYWVSLRMEPVDQVSVNLNGRRSQLRDQLDDGGASTNGSPERRDYRRSTGGARVLWQYTPAVALHVAADEILRYPKVDEYFGFDENFSPTVLDLKPQTGVNTEVGMRWQDADRSISAQIWRLQLRNEITYDPASFQNTNLARTRREGYSVQATLPAAPLWTLHAEWHHQSARLDNGRQIPLVAKDTGLLRLTHAPTPQSSLEWNLRAVGPRQPGGDYDGSQNALPGYATLGAAWRHVTDKGVSLSVRSDNLLGKKYVETAYEDFGGATVIYPLPRQTWRAELGWEW